MTHPRIAGALATAIAGALLVTLPAPPASAARTTLRGSVHDDFDSLRVGDRTVTHGRYRIVVRDASTMHNWHISGEGVDKRTTVGGTGRWVWKVRLRPGTYKIVCDPHHQQMKLRLTVT
jgi:hypothetical protein